MPDGCFLSCQCGGAALAGLLYKLLVLLVSHLIYVKEESWNRDDMARTGGVLALGVVTAHCERAARNSDHAHRWRSGLRSWAGTGACLCVRYACELDEEVGDDGQRNGCADEQVKPRVGASR